jgi:hypothetical protein
MAVWRDQLGIRHWAARAFARKVGSSPRWQETLVAFAKSARYGLMTVLLEANSRASLDAERCKNRPIGPDSWRNLKKFFTAIFPLKSKA